MGSEVYISHGAFGHDFYYCFSLLNYEDLPILFVALDENGVVYLCDCTEFRFGVQKWTIGETNPKIIKDIINGITPVDIALRLASDSVILAECDLETDTYTQKRVKANEVSVERMPKSNTILSCPCDDAMNELVQFEIELQMRYGRAIEVQMAETVDVSMSFSQIDINSEATQIYIDDVGKQSQRSAQFKNEIDNFDFSYRGDEAA